MDVVLSSGAKLSITMASFEDVMELKSAIGAAIGKVELTPEVWNADMSVGGIMGSPVILSSIMDKIRLLVISKDVRLALFKCFQRVTYNDVRITPTLFDDPTTGEAMRRDYFTICSKVIELNLKPFFEQTFSALQGLAKTQAVTQK